MTDIGANERRNHFRRLARQRAQAANPPALPTVDVTEDGWRANAACRGVDPDLFFPVGEIGSAPAAEIALAREVCAACPVKEDCLAYALSDASLQGVWAGTTERQRALMRRAKRRAS